MRKTLTVALDIGNVCVRLEYENVFRAAGLEPGSTLPEDADRAFCELECGRIETEEWLDVLWNSLGRQFSKEHLLNGWNSILAEPFPGVEKYIRKYTESGVKFVYLSDISRLHLNNVCRMLPFAHLIYDGVYSFEAGVRKPGAAMYELFEKRHGVPDFYFDDKLCNIEGARKRGWNAIQFTHAEQLGLIGDAL